MGLWTGIKHALNSTLGTENFQPLDKIIEGQRTLAASDNVIRVITPPTGSFRNQTSIGSFTPKVGNSIRVSVVFAPNSATNKTVQLYVGGGGKNFSTSATFNATTGVTTNGFMEIDVPIEAGVTYGISMSSSDSIRVVSCKLCASITDANLVEV